MDSLKRFQFQTDFVVGLLTAMTAVCTLVAMSDVDAKYKLALVAVIGGTAALAFLPERRVICIALWALLHPLGIEKIFYVDAAESPQFTEPAIIFNASDGPLALLALILVAEVVVLRREAFRWSRMTTILLMFLVWSIVSFAIHATYLDDGFTASAPYALLQDVRLLIFALLVQSAIRSRGDLMLVLLAVGVAVLLQTGIVAVSYSTGQVFNYASTMLPAGAAKLQGFDSSGGGQLLRASGTVGQVNEQAIFHAVMTFPLIAFFITGDAFVARSNILIVAASTAALILTFSRGAWLAFPIGLVVCVAVAARRQMIGRKGILAGVAVCVGAAITLLLMAHPIYQRLAYGDTGATAARLRLLALATDLFESYPLVGVGPGEFDEAALRLYPPNVVWTQWVGPDDKADSPSMGGLDYMELRSGDLLVRRPLPVHNKFMLTLSELGLPGLVLWLWLYAAYIRLAWRCSKLPDPFVGLLGAAGLGHAAAELTYMTVEHFHDDKPLELALFMPAVMFAAWRHANLDAARARLNPSAAVGPTQVGI